MKLTFQPKRVDINLCWKVSNFRYNVNKKMGWIKGEKNDNLLNGFTGALGELAVSKMFGIEWEGAMLSEHDYKAWREIRADLGPFEVKTISYIKGCLMLKENDKDFAHALLMWVPGARDVGLCMLRDAAPDRVLLVKLLGYLDVKTAKKIGEKQRNRWVITQDKLKDPMELQKFYDHFNKQRLINPFIKSGKIPSFRLTR